MARRRRPSGSDPGYREGVDQVEELDPWARALRRTSGQFASEITSRRRRLPCQPSTSRLARRVRLAAQLAEAWDYLWLRGAWRCRSPRLGLAERREWGPVLYPIDQVRQKIVEKVEMKRRQKTIE